MAPGFVYPFIVAIGLTALGGPWPFLEALPIFTSLDFETMFLTEVGLSAQPPAILDDRWFSVGVVSLSWPALTKASGNRSAPLRVLAVKEVAQGPWHGHACMGLGRDEWHFLSFISTQLTVSHAPSGPLATPLDPLFFPGTLKFVHSYKYCEHIGWNAMTNWEECKWRYPNTSPRCIPPRSSIC